jgi:hypothetical protein
MGYDNEIRGNGLSRLTLSEEAHGRNLVYGVRSSRYHQFHERMGQVR